MSRFPCDVLFQNLSKAMIGSCVLEALTFFLTMASAETRSKNIVSMINDTYYEAFANVVQHVDTSIKMFSQDEFIREVKRLAVFSGLVSLSQMIDDDQELSDSEVRTFFKDVRKLCETLI